MTKGSPISPSLMASKAPARSGDAARTKDVAASVSSTVDAVNPVQGPNHIVPPTEMTGSQAVVRSLEELGVDDVFGLPGGAFPPAYDPLMYSAKINHILVRHELEGGHVAQGYEMVTGRAGVCIATS